MEIFEIVDEVLFHCIVDSILIKELIDCNQHTFSKRRFALRLASKTPSWKSLSIKSEKIFLPVFPAEFELFRKFPFSHDQMCQRGSIQYSHYISQKLAIWKRWS